MNEVISKLKELIDVKSEYDKYNTPTENANEKNEACMENGRLLSLLFSLNCKYHLRSEVEFEPKIEELEKYKNDIFCDVDSQSKLDITESLARIFCQKDNKDKAAECIKEYIYILFKEMYSDVADKQDGKLKLFSFRGFSDYAKEDVIENKLTLSQPEKFNDPFDTLLPHWLEYTLRQLHEKYDAHKVQEMKQEMCKYIKARSFVLAKDDAVENLPQLMWAHYANDHKGFCIKYEFDKEFFNADDESKFALVWQKIKYVHNDFQYNEGIRLSEALLTKSDIWSYENELRLLMFNPSRGGDFVPVTLGEHARITDIYLGERCSDEDMNFMKAVVDGKGIYLHRMKKNDDCAFKLDCEWV